MMLSLPIGQVIKQRYSCRVYDKRPVASALQAELLTALGSMTRGPLGTQGRFTLVAASEDNSRALKGLGSYGFIKNAAGYLVGAVVNGESALEEFGYLMELAVLHATAQGLGTCWLGGIYSKSNFAKKLELAPEELMPAVVSLGYVADSCPAEERVRRREASNCRFPAEVLFRAGGFETPLPLSAAGAYHDALEMVRWAPSANNKQPWRVVRTESGWHFYLVRSRGYGKGSLLFTLLRIPDLQRVDIGIAMCHFELTLREAGVGGSWVREAPRLAVPAENVEYVITWRPDR